MTDKQKNQFRACLLAGACGDALGAAVEFDRYSAILAKHGPSGIRDFKPCYQRLGAVTDDTQMSLFTAEGLLRGYVRGRLRGTSSYTGTVAHAYIRWLRTQGDNNPHTLTIAKNDGWLFGLSDLHHPRAPGTTCLIALRAMTAFGRPAVNDSKGCGGIMRVAPVALFLATGRKRESFTGEESFQLANDIAALTHGHPTGQLSAGVFATILEGLLLGVPLHDALDKARQILQRYPGHQETLMAMTAADLQAQSNLSSVLAIAELGEGWVAEEALAIALYALMTTSSLEEAVILGVNHDGDSDSTGLLAGQLAGAIYGTEAVPGRWLEQLELRQVIDQVALDLYEYPTWRVEDLSCDEDDRQNTEQILRRYPGH
ncbi:MAG: ADP-ribosylglycohydrolase family protein [Halomonadaceae bacterium]|nr:MAG: ADP-ribosylglycohydrolase family protein [Halomonadaceae bacterium]